uniref:Late blight resistance protein n=1 Tax=Solanum tuberosum TaxID=4113 RepID=M1D3A8_SOLTU
MPETSKERIRFLKRDFELLHIFLSFTDLSTSKERIRFLKRDFEHIFLSFTDLSCMADVTYKAEALFQDAVVDFKKVNKINHIGRVTSQIEEKTGCIS